MPPVQTWPPSFAPPPPPNSVHAFVGSIIAANLVPLACRPPPRVHSTYAQVCWHHYCCKPLFPLAGSPIQVYSVHAFIGAITLAAAAGQYLFGACAFLAFRNRMTDERRARLAGWHAFFGKATFSSGVITCMVRASVRGSVVMGNRSKQLDATATTRQALVWRWQARARRKRR